MTTITLLHPGEMGAAIGAEAVRAGTRVFWVPSGRSLASRERAKRAGLEAASLADALAASDAVLSVCPAHVAEDVAEAVAQHHFTGRYIDANPIALSRLGRITALLPDARVGDASIFGPDRERHRVARMYCSTGTDPGSATLLQQVFHTTSVEVRPLPGPAGQASALKLAYLAFQRTARMQAALTHALADQHALTEYVLEEARKMPSPDLTDPGFTEVLRAKAWRWHHELREAAVLFDEAGLSSDLLDAAATNLAGLDAPSATDEA
ncbi:DUF1932 domain-containing protein [Streptomyces sp. MS19]|uniref:DUF1932 domain-containing protein n=1 Tax=Streptomyces sp. MS19 TaxID=3385972 RepID=UPI00399F2CE7